MQQKYRMGLKIGILLLIVMASVWLIRNYSLMEIRTWMHQFGAAAPLFYIGLFTVLPIFLFPVPVLVLAAGILFGIEKGTAYTLIGSVLNSFLMFYFGRFLLRDLVNQFLAARIPASISSRLHSDNQKVLASVFFVLRLIPLVSYNLINYAAGITQIRLPVYLMTTVIGILPGTIVFLNTGDKSLNVKSMDFAVSIGLLIALTAISGWILKMYVSKISENHQIK